MDETMAARRVLSWAALKAAKMAASRAVKRDSKTAAKKDLMKAEKWVDAKMDAKKVAWLAVRKAA